jgi:ClpP class serine protease
MPWKVERDEEACSVSKPWAVKNSDTGAVNGRCHATKEKAEKQKRALYASYRKEGKSVQVVEEYPQIVRAITGTPWLIVPENLEAILDIVNMRLNGQAFSDDELRMRLDAAKDSDRENPNVQVDGGVGVLSLYGPMFPKANLMTMLSGATSLETFQNDLQTLVDDDKVKQIVIDYNSPGGTSDMVHETGDLIRQARDVKPIYGIANTIAGSGALWLLAQSTKAYATPSGKVGSLGVYTTHEDLSAQDEKDGRKITIISAGHLKTAGDPHEPLSDEARAYLQESVTNSIKRLSRKLQQDEN